MEFKYSVEIDSATVNAAGCFTTLPVRFHQDEDAAIRASKRMEKDWEDTFGEAPFSEGCQSAHAHLSAVSLPECIPERIGIATYIMDYMLHHDDIADLDISKAKETHSTLGHELDPSSKESPLHVDVKTRKTAFQGRMMKELMCIDQEGAKRLLHVWSEYMSISAEGMDIDFKSMKQYLPYRMKEAGIPLFLAIARYAMNINLTEAEIVSAQSVLLPLSLSMALVNDYFSWDKEYIDYLRKGPSDGRLYSSIKLLMDEHNVSVASAKKMVRQMIVKYEQDYVKLRDEWLAEEERPVELRRYVEQMGFMAAGSLYWHAKAPRYHNLGNLGDLPQEKIKAGISRGEDGPFVSEASITPDFRSVTFVN